VESMKMKYHIGNYFIEIEDQWRHLKHHKSIKMKPKIAAQSGTFESSDVIFLIEPLPDNSGRKLEISSTVMQQFGTSFNRIVVEMLDFYELTDIHLIAKDKGALEPTIKARLETAIKRSLDQQEGTLK